MSFSDVRQLVLKWAGVAALWGGGDSVAQGTFRAYNNFTRFGPQAKAYVTTCDEQGLAVPVPKAMARLEILNAFDGSVLSPNRDGMGEPFIIDGLFFVGVMTVPEVPVGGSVNLILRVWHARLGRTYENALPRGEVSFTVANLGGGQVPLATLFQDSNFVKLHISTLNGCPGPPGPLKLTLMGDGTVQLTSSGSIGFAYSLEGTKDFWDWRFLGYQMPELSAGHGRRGEMVWRVPLDAVSTPSQFFRIHSSPIWP